MKKQDLKSGMVVKFRNRDKLHILVIDIFCSIVNCYDLIRLEEFDENLNHSLHSDYDIVEIYKCKSNHALSDFMKGKVDMMWQRK